MTIKFLITGYPRMRSAWLAALFSSDRVLCFHDGAHHGGVAQLLHSVGIAKDHEAVGLFDPCAACVYPRKALELFNGHQIVVVRRDESDSRRALEAWCGHSLPNWGELRANYQHFTDVAPRSLEWIDFEALDDFTAVSNLYRICTGGLSLDRRRFDLFNTLRIDQHRDKAIRAAAAIS